MLTPRITYERQVRFTSQGPVVVHILRGPRPGGLYALRPVLSNGFMLGRETVTSMQRRVSGTATVAGVNGDFFSWDEGLPTGMHMESGVLMAPPHPLRSSLGITDDGTLVIDKVRMLGQWEGTGPRRQLGGLNQRPGPGSVRLFTPAWGGATPAAQGTFEVTLHPFPPAAPDTELLGSVEAVKNGGGTPIPPDGAVLVGRGAAGERLVAEAPIGQTMSVRLFLRPAWEGIVDAIGAGPMLVSDGQPIFSAQEDFSSSLTALDPRTGVGQLAAGKIVMVAVDGRQPGYSTGVTNFELAQTLAGLGAMNAMALDSGGSTTAAFDGHLLNHPSDPGGERAIGDGLFLFYYGVHAPPATQAVLSPNGDGVAESQRLSYKIVRPSTVTASIVGPDRIPRQTQIAERAPGTYRLTWSGRTPAGTPETEGRWRWVVNALDDQQQQSSVTRVFSLNNTLGYLRVRPSRLVVHKRAAANLQVGFRLAHSAVVTVRIETARGVRVRVIRQRRRAGQATIRWNGRYANGTRAFSGPYIARVQTSNAFGRAELKRRFSVRRARR